VDRRKRYQTLAHRIVCVYCQRQTLGLSRMKLLHMTSVYPQYVERFYAARHGLASRSYEEHYEAFFYDAFAWADAWKSALEPIGYEVREVVTNVAPMQRMWARQNMRGDPASVDLNSIAVEQVRRFAPDVLWFDHHDAGLLALIRERVPQMKLVLGWTGSAIPQPNAFAHCDMVLSCSRESVDRLTAQGKSAAELSHGFDPRVLARLSSSTPSTEVVFIGQLIRSSDFHIVREKLLERAVEALPVKIFSPSARLRPARGAKGLLKEAISMVYCALNSVGGQKLAARLLRAVGKTEDWLQPSTAGLNRKLVPYVVDGVYGLEMYQVVRDAKVTLNIHADSSERYASNMRLFEVTGVGGCLLTDWKSNLADMFSIDREVVAYRSAEELVEKARWLLEHPVARADIAHAGQSRTLRDYTFARRAVRFNEIVRSALRKVAVH
jgi:spore maturation protein CgeB